MGNDFFDGLGRTISRTARELSGHAENFYETQKLRNKISSEERIMEKVLADIGKLIYQRFAGGEILDEELAVLCEEVSQHEKIAELLRKKEADVRGQKLCAACGKSVDQTAVYCPYCGAKCTVSEEEDEI